MISGRFVPSNEGRYCQGRVSLRRVSSQRWRCSGIPAGDHATPASSPPCPPASGLACGVGYFWRRGRRDGARRDFWDRRLGLFAPLRSLRLAAAFGCTACWRGGFGATDAAPWARALLGDLMISAISAHKSGVGPARAPPGRARPHSAAPATDLGLPIGGLGAEVFRNRRRLPSPRA